MRYSRDRLAENSLAVERSGVQDDRLAPTSDIPRTRSATSAPPAWLWLWLPLVIVVVQALLRTLDESLYRTWLRSESGLIENLTVICLLIAVFHALRLFSLRDRVRSRTFGAFVIFLALGCAFFAGEELSWGQHWLGFETPEVFAARNEQGELNLHNDPAFELYLDQIPRSLLTLAALFGGIIAPLTFRRGAKRDFATRSMSGWVWPTAVCLPASVIAVLVTQPKKFIDDLPAYLDISPGETKELCLALFLMLYLFELERDLRAGPTA